MSVLLSFDDVKRQSQSVWNQFSERWKKFSRLNARLPNRRDPAELRNMGVGKFAVLAAMGESLVEDIPHIKKYRDRFDLITCDKGFPILMSQGIKPDYVQICDTNIPYKWVEPWVSETAGIKLLATTYANVEWTHRWKGPIYLYVNKDALDSQKEFFPILDNPNPFENPTLESEISSNSAPPIRVIPAGSNVSNAMLIFLVGVDEQNLVNWGGYEHYFLTGYDYCWRPTGKDLKCKTGNYYAFEDPRPKRFYMNHRTLLDINGDVVLTSENLLFSAKWMYSYLTSFNLPVTNCSERGLLEIPRRLGLEKCLEKINPSRQAREDFLVSLTQLSQAQALRDSCEHRVQKARRELWLG